MFSLLIGAALFATVSPAFAQTPWEMCEAMYPIKDKEINFVSEKTGHDPRQFLIRRCINKERKKIAEQKRIKREESRKNFRSQRAVARMQALEKRLNMGVSRNLDRQEKKRSMLRKDPNRIGQGRFRVDRSSRRAVVRKAEGLDRINSLRRRLRRQNKPDPCESVGAIRRFNNPCKNYGERAGRVR